MMRRRRLVMWLGACLMYQATMAQPDADTVHWSAARKLTLDDYRGKPDTASGFKALSYLVSPSYWMFRNDTLFIRISCFFRKSGSWFVKQSHDPSQVTELLKHEQGHFDLGEVEIRKVKKRFVQNQRTITRYNYQVVVPQYLSEIDYFLNKRQRQYDRETDYSMNRKEQEQWLTKISTELASLEQFTPEVLVITVRR